VSDLELIQRCLGHGGPMDGANARLRDLASDYRR